MKNRKKIKVIFGNGSTLEYITDKPAAEIQPDIQLIARHNNTYVRQCSILSCDAS